MRFLRWIADLAFDRSFLLELGGAIVAAATLYRTLFVVNDMPFGLQVLSVSAVTYLSMKFGQFLEKKYPKDG